MPDHDHDHLPDDGRHLEPVGARTMTMAPTVTPATTPTGLVEARVVQLSDEAVEDLRRHVEEASGGGSRFAWFTIGFVAALAAGVVAAVVFLAVSDRDDDGNVNLDVPAVELDVGS